jgi:hypothetical protein
MIGFYSTTCVAERTQLIARRPTECDQMGLVWARFVIARSSAPLAPVYWERLHVCHSMSAKNLIPAIETQLMSLHLATIRGLDKVIGAMAL